LSLSYSSNQVSITVNESVAKRRAAAALLRMAKSTTDLKVAARFIEAAADLKDEAGDLPVPVSSKAPDVQDEAHQVTQDYADDQRSSRS